MKILDLTNELRGPIQQLLDSASRINANKPQRYWYPLSMASYDVEEILAAVDSLCSFRTTMWDKTAEFESRFGGLIGGEAIMVNSGSSADLLVAFALVNPESHLLQRGDEVLVPSVTWPTQLWSLMMAGLSVRLVDTDPKTLNVSIDDLETKIGPKTRAISLVHLMGNPVDMNRVLDICRRNELLLVEDCCEALGSRFEGKAVGSFGLASAFSFFFSHHITTMEGGMIVCQGGELSDLMRLLRAHGWARNTRYRALEAAPGIDPRYMFLNWGFNVRPTELQAGFGLVQLDRLGAFHETRVANANYFASLLAESGAGLRLMEVHPDAECSWFALPLMVQSESGIKRDDLVQFLENEGVETRPIVAGSLARQPVADIFPELKEDDLPGADLVHDHGFYLGLHPFDSKDKLERLAGLIATFAKSNG